MKNRGLVLWLGRGGVERTAAAQNSIITYRRDFVNSKSAQRSRLKTPDICAIFFQKMLAIRLCLC